MPFLRNVWYVAANASELDAGLVSRTICNEPIVMFRTESGGVAALQDRCPHRFVPLSMGQRVGDTLQCGYHGLRFAADGSCAEMPNDRDNTVLKPCVKAYPLVERYGVLWLWIGEPAQAMVHRGDVVGYLPHVVERNERNLLVLEQQQVRQGGLGALDLR